MLNPEITRFILDQRRSSVPDDTIRATLSASGWQAADIEAAFAAITQPSQAVSAAAPEPGAGLTPDQERIVRSWSSGALVPFLYSASMRLWILLGIEVAIYLSPAWLGALAHFLPDTISTFFGFLFLLLVFVPAAALLLMAYRVMRGKRLAWKARPWRDFDEFLSVQKRWDVAGRIILILVILPLLLIVLTLGLSTLRSRGDSSQAGVSSTPSPQAASSTPNPSLQTYSYTRKLPNYSVQYTDFWSISQTDPSTGTDSLQYRDAKITLNSDPSSDFKSLDDASLQIYREAGVTVQQQKMTVNGYPAQQTITPPFSASDPYYAIETQVKGAGLAIINLEVPYASGSSLSSIQPYIDDYDALLKTVTFAK